MKFRLLGLLILAALGLVWGCGNSNSSGPTSPGAPAATATPSGPTVTFTNTATFTNTGTFTFTPTKTFTGTPTSTSSFTVTATKTATPSFTSTSTVTNTNSPTVTFTATSTPTCSGSGGSILGPTWSTGPSGGSDLLVARPITLPNLARITDFQLYDYTGTVQTVGIYADSGGAPSTLIVAASGTEGNGAAQGNSYTTTITFTTSVVLQPGTYWLVAESAANPSGGVQVPTSELDTGGMWGYYGYESLGAGHLPATFPAPYSYTLLYGAPGVPTIGADWVCP